MLGQKGCRSYKHHHRPSTCKMTCHLFECKNWWGIKGGLFTKLMAYWRTFAYAISLLLYIYLSVSIYLLPVCLSVRPSVRLYLHIYMIIYASIDMHAIELSKLCTLYLRIVDNGIHQYTTYYIYIYTHIYIHIYMCIYIYTYIYIYIYKYICVYIYIYTYIYIHIYIYVHTCVI